jgi:hypothetical protein
MSDVNSILPKGIPHRWTGLPAFLTGAVRVIQVLLTEVNDLFIAVRRADVVSTSTGREIKTSDVCRSGVLFSPGSTV